MGWFTQVVIYRISKVAILPLWPRDRPASYFSYKTSCNEKQTLILSQESLFYRTTNKIFKQPIQNSLYLNCSQMKLTFSYFVFLFNNFSQFQLTGLANSLPGASWLGLSSLWCAGWNEPLPILFSKNTLNKIGSDFSSQGIWASFGVAWFSQAPNQLAPGKEGLPVLNQLGVWSCEGLQLKSKKQNN